MTLRAAGWLRHHWLELAITTALTATITLTPWLALLPAAWLAWWATREHRAHTHRPRTPPPDSTTSDTDTQTDRSEATA